MAGRGNRFPQNYSTSDSFESSSFPNLILEENREHLYSVDNEVINDLRRHTRDYVKKIVGLPIIPDLPEESIRKKTALYWKTLC